MKAILAFLVILLSLAIFLHIYLERQIPICIDGIVIDRYASDRIYYLDGSISDNWVNEENEYFVFILRKNGTMGLLELGRGDLGYFRASMLEPGSRLSCLQNRAQKYEKFIVSN